jgi:hypothetical protein
MRPLVIGTKEKAAIVRVIVHALARPISLDRSRRILAKLETPPTLDDPGFSLSLPVGFCVTFTFEQHPVGWARHISVSVDNAAHDKIPHPFGVQAIMTEFGMLGAQEDCTEWVAEAWPGRLAQNVVERIKDPGLIAQLEERIKAGV